MESDLSNLPIERDASIMIHKRGAIGLLCRPFASHEKGLPEWVKNAAGAYNRAEVDDARRVVVLLFRNGDPNSRAAIGCLDFVGMDESDIAAFKEWADPEAAGRGREDFIYGGHGSGGKCYMLNMFENSLITTVRDGVLNCIGFAEGEPQSGYRPDAERGCNVAVPDARVQLAEHLALFQLTINDLPESAQEALNSSGSFTLVAGFGPRGLTPTRLPAKSLTDHVAADPQMIDAVQYCQLHGFDNGRSLGRIELPDIEPVEHYADPKTIPVPTELLHSRSGASISTVAGPTAPAGQLTLWTSKENMWRKHKTLRHRHRIVYRTRRGTAGSRPVRELVSSGRGDRVYGICQLEILSPSYVSAERHQLVPAPLTEALEEWIAERVVEYAEEFEEFESWAASEEERDHLQELNKHLDSWKNALIDTLDAADGSGADEDGGGGRRRGGRRANPPGGGVARIEMCRPELTAGLRVVYRPQPRAYDAKNRLVARPPLRWTTSDPRIAQVNEQTGEIMTRGLGRGRIVATADGGASASLMLRVVRIVEIKLSPLSLSVGVGRRKAVLADVVLDDDSTSTDVLLEWESLDAQVAFVGPFGFVTGNREGRCLVAARDWSCSADEDVDVTVVEAPEGDELVPGSGPPRVLLSSIDPDPESGEPVHLAATDPPVNQRHSDVNRGIFWINTSSPLARRYLDEEAGYGVHRREWRIYHVERYVDVVSKIRLTSNTESMSPDDFINEWEEVQIQLQEAAARDLGAFLDTGHLG